MGNCAEGEKTKTTREEARVLDSARENSTIGQSDGGEGTTEQPTDQLLNDTTKIWEKEASSRSAFNDAPRMSGKICVALRIGDNSRVVHERGKNAESLRGVCAAFDASGPWPAASKPIVEGTAPAANALEQCGVVDQQSVTFRLFRACNQNMITSALIMLCTKQLQGFCHPVLVASKTGVTWCVDFEINRHREQDTVHSVVVKHTRREQHTSPATDPAHFSVTWQLVLEFDGSLSELKAARSTCLEVVAGENMPPARAAELAAAAGLQ